MKNEANKTIEKLEEVINFLEEDGDINIDECIEILNKLEEIKKTINK